MVAVKGDVMVVRPRSKVKRRLSRGVNVVYKGLEEEEFVMEADGCGGVAGSEGSEGSESSESGRTAGAKGGLLFDGDSNNIV